MFPMVGPFRGGLQKELDQAVDRALGKVKNEINAEREELKEKIESASLLVTTYMEDMKASHGKRNEELNGIHETLKAILKELQKLNKK